MMAVKAEVVTAVILRVPVALVCAAASPRPPPVQRFPFVTFRAWACFLRLGGYLSGRVSSSREVVNN
jgi:hypothetical protein